MMGSGTDWGNEEHHSDYESYVNTRTNRYDDDFNVYLSHDGSLDIITAYDAARALAYDTTFDVNGDLTCVWMDQNYDWNSPAFRDRCGESINLAVNYLTDVLYTLYMSRSAKIYQVTWEGVTYVVPIDTNSTPTGFTFNQSAKRISFNLTGSSGTVGYCNVTIPIPLLGGPYAVLVDGSPVTSTETSNSTHSFLHFTYTHSTHAVEIMGTHVIPEFPKPVIVPILLTALAVVLILLRKRMSRIL